MDPIQIVLTFKSIVTIVSGFRFPPYHLVWEEGLPYKVLQARQAGFPLWSSVVQGFVFPPSGLTCFEREEKDNVPH